MKPLEKTLKQLTVVVLVLMITIPVKGQWGINGNDIYYNTGNVGIGTATPGTRLQIDFDAPNTTLTGLSAYGGLHLKQSTTNDEFVGITTPGTSAGTQGGILFQGSGFYGTKIHFLTTESYAAGMKQRMIIDHYGRVGIGTTGPTATLDVSSDSYPPFRTTRATTSVTNGVLGVAQLLASTTQDMADGFAANLDFGIEDNAVVKNVIATITGVRDGADNSGSLQIKTYASGVVKTAAHFDSDGNIGIGTAVPGTRLQIDFDAPNTTLTGLSAYGGLHLKQSTANDEFVGITTPGTSAGTQGGILFQGSGFYGTKIHFLTTESYAAGMKQRMIIDHYGRVGIGTTMPGVLLDVLAPSGSQQGIRFTDNGNVSLSIYRDADVGNWALLRSDLGNGIAIIGQPDVIALSVDRTTNNVGIGTTTTPEKLTVNGKILAEEVQVVVDVPDYVFAKEYKLKTLAEVSKFINEHKHLPEVPSEKEVLDNCGQVSLGEMNMTLLKKIEELTLYAIVQENNIKDQENNIKEQKENSEKQEEVIKSLLKRVTELEK